MLLVGLTGNYGMGKSTVLSMFKNLGVVTFDSDKIVDSLLSENMVIEKVRELMGEMVFDKKGNLDKKRVADLIFKNDTLKNLLENILHPLVFERIDNFTKTINNKDTVVIVEVPLLFERGYEGRFDRTVTVFTDERTALHRLEKASISKDEAMQRLRSQLPIKVKTEKSDYVINNNNTIKETMEQVASIYAKLLQEVAFGNN